MRQSYTTTFTHSATCETCFVAENSLLKQRALLARGNMIIPHTFKPMATMGARRNFPEGGGQNDRHFKKFTRFRRAVRKIDHFSFFATL